ncbi:leucine-rich repeat domain-containing protein, partial [Prevotella histicola]
MKQIYILLIALLMGLSANAGKSGFCGPHLKWHLTDYGVLTISGKGIMKDYTSWSPWIYDSVKRVIIADGVTTIGDNAFNGCSSLTSVTIPNSVTTIGWRAFNGCSSLTSVTIPNSVTIIGWSAFSGCSSLTSVTIPNSVIIGGSAFSGCSSLTSVTIPNSVTTIREYTFDDCNSLTSVTIPNSVTTIERSAFSSCTNLQKVNIGNSVKTIGTSAFDYCTSITQISSEAVVPPTCGINALNGINKSKCKLIVPKNSLDAYKQADQWKDFLLIEGSTTGITNPVYNNSGLADVYTIDGTKRLSKASTDEINALPKGVYIVN